MHGSLAANRALLTALKAKLAKPAAGVDYAVFSPFPYLQQLQAELTGSAIGWGAQNVSEHDTGAFTGEVSGTMLRDFGCRYVLVGHSERRQLYDESDARVAEKFAAAQRAGLTPVLCIGETLQQREQGDTEVVLARQLDAVLKSAGVAALGGAVLAYEPVWAIGTGKNATPAQAQSAHEYVRGLVAAKDKAVGEKVTILYGGSMKPGNARDLLAQPDVDGGLIGGASLVAEDFLQICEAAVTN
jgi:triosephosphate isomerase